LEASHLSAERRTVLVVDDHSSVREGLGIILDEAYDVLFAEDGFNALQVLTSRRVDAVLLDLGLRGMDGFETMSRMFSIAPSLPIIIITIRNTAADAVRALKLGARDYLTKPFDEETIHSTLVKALAVPTSSAMRNASAREGSVSDSWRLLGSSNSYLRPQCLVVADHLGTAGLLRVVLDRYVPTNTSTKCFLAAQMLGIEPPACVVIDGSSWDANGVDFVRILRTRFAPIQVVVLTEEMAGNHRTATPADRDVVHCHGIGAVIRYVLGTCLLMGRASQSEMVSDHVCAALDFLRAHYGDQLTIERLARVAGMSRGYLARRFQRELGTSVGQFVMTLRVEIARLMLTEHKVKLDDVAALAGFVDPSHLSRAFRGRTGYRPGAYRRRFGLVH